MCVCVCLYRRISLTTKQKSPLHVASPGKVYSYFEGGYHHPPEKMLILMLFYALLALLKGEPLDATAEAATIR